MHPSRRLGQHFLSDPRLLERIALALNPEPYDVVLEIGPGRGSLTRQLVSRVGRVYAIEKDPRLCAELESQAAAWPGPPPQILEGDALKVDWKAMVGPGSYKLVGNIPYQITTPLLERALRAPRPALCVLLVQKEVGERLGAAPGTKRYGALSVGVQSAAHIERLFRVRAGAFWPPPRVDSVVVRLTPRADPLVAADEEPAFRQFVKGCFARRRKQLRTALAAIWKCDRTTVDGVLARLHLDGEQRPEALTVEQFVLLLRGQP